MNCSRPRGTTLTRIALTSLISTSGRCAIGSIGLLGLRASRLFGAAATGFARIVEVNRLPTRWRLTLGFAIVMAILLTATGLFVRDRVRTNLDSSLDASLHTQAAEVAALAQQSDTGLAEAKPIPHGGQRPQVAQI